MDHSAPATAPGAPVRALVVTNMYPTAQRPEFGSFVRDQVEALGRLDGVDVELRVIDSGVLPAYARAVGQLRRKYAGRRFDVVHAHYGLTAWPALAVRGAVHGVTLHGTDLADRRARAVSIAALPWLDLVGAVSAPLGASIPRWALRRGVAASVLPCGVDLRRFAPIDRAAARQELGLAPDRRCLLFPADPARPEKRFDRARALQAALGGCELLALGGVPPDRVPLLINAADAVVIPSEREGFGLAVLEALACEVPVLATPVGIAPEVLRGVPGTLCTPFSAPQWAAAVRAFCAPGHPAAVDAFSAAAGPEASGRAAAARYSADAMAQRLLDAWRAALARSC